ncbi:MAG TPA: class I SAM-dependent methyltransferase [Crocinitomicaceae bacterium]|nr:class I SAM-dependent methyltransferase [Crocinitomicaceae bacterium]
MVNRIKKPWPTKDAMEQIYTQHLWGRNNDDFYSGEGSHLPEIVNPYIDALTSFLTSFAEPLEVCDLGCGDFNVGKELVKFSKKFIAIDIVPDLIVRNKEKYKTENLEFHCLNIAEDDLPKGDCAIVRQVLQHLSNSEIQSVVSKLKNYRYVILTEHLPEGEFISNKDIISGQGTRLKKGSGVDLLVAPFNLKVKAQKELVNIDLGKRKGKIVTMLYN